MDTYACTNPTCSDGSHERSTYIDLFGYEREERLYAPDREDDAEDPPQFRMHPIACTLSIDIGHCGVGNTIKHYIGQEEVHDAAIEYRRQDGDVWLDADDPGRPAPRDQPPLTREQVAVLIRERPDLADVPYAEPLVFLAMADTGHEFWGRAVAAGWVPTQRDLKLLADACSRLGVRLLGAGHRA